MSRPQLVLLVSWLVVAAALAAVGGLTWHQSHPLLAEAFWAAAVVVAVAVVVLVVWYRTRPGATRRW